jgi:hypothetical protein
LDPRNFFPITSCVVFARLNGPWGDIKLHRKAARPLAPGTEVLTTVRSLF